MISVKFYEVKDGTHRRTLTLEQSDRDVRNLAVCTDNEVVEVNARELLNAVRFLIGEV